MAAWFVIIWVHIVFTLLLPLSAEWVELESHQFSVIRGALRLSPQFSFGKAVVFVLVQQRLDKAGFYRQKAHQWFLEVPLLWVGVTARLTSAQVHLFELRPPSTPFWSTLFACDGVQRVFLQALLAKAGGEELSLVWSGFWVERPRDWKPDPPRPCVL